MKSESEREKSDATTTATDPCPVQSDRGKGVAWQGAPRGPGVKGKRRTGDGAFAPPGMRPREEGYGVALRGRPPKVRRPPPAACRGRDGGGDEEVVVGSARFGSGTRFSG